MVGIHGHPIYFVSFGGVIKGQTDGFFEFVWWFSVVVFVLV